MLFICEAFLFFDAKICVGLSLRPQSDVEFNHLHANDFLTFMALPQPSGQALAVCRGS